MPIDNLSKITSRSGINTTILLEAGNANVTGIVTAAGFDGPFTGGSGSDINAGIVTARGGLHVGAGGTIIHALSEDDGLVGIGTTNPQKKLEVFDGDIYLNSTDKKIFLSNDYDQYITANAASNYVVLGAGNKERVRIRSDNYIGIGTDVISKYVTIKAVHPFVRLEASDTSDKRLDFQVSTAGIATISAEQSSQQLSFKTTGGEALRIDSDGKVGIGTDLTTTPSSVLTVAPFNSTSGRNISIYTSGAVGNKAGLFFNSTSGTGNLAEIQAEYKGTNEGELVLSTSLQKRITIQKGGNVGIGSENPGKHLDVYRNGLVNARIKGNVAGGLGAELILQNANAAADGYSEIQFQDSGTNVFSKIRGFNLTDGSNNGYMALYTASATQGLQERVRISDAGKVGINSTSPTNTLVVRESTDNNSSLQLFRASTGGDISSIIWATNQGNQASINYRGGGGSVGMQFYTGGTGSSNLRAIITSDGKIGINTTIPESPLEIMGDSTLGDAKITFNRAATVGNDGVIGELFFQNNTDSVALIAAKRESATDDAYIQFATQQTGAGLSEKLRITSDGKVGIATATPPDWCRFSIDHGQYGLTRFSNHSHLLLQNKNAGTTEFWSLAPRDNGSISMVRGGVDVNGTVADTQSTFSISSAGRVGIGSLANSSASFFEMSSTSGAEAYPFQTFSQTAYQYQPFNHEVTIRNNTLGQTDNFCGICFLPGAHTDGNRISAARISAIDTGDYRADLSLGTRGYRDGNIGFQEVLRLDSNGNASIADGNLAFANGHGIDFSATGDGSGSMTSELLDDYEEGSFTPTSNATLSTAAGSYTKVGRLVTVHIRVTFSSQSSSTAVNVGGLPYTAGMPGVVSNGSVPGGFGYVSGGSVIPQIHMIHNTTSMNFYNFQTGMTISNFSGKEFRFGLVYHT